MTMTWKQENDRLWSTEAGYTITKGFHETTAYVLRGTTDERPLPRFPSLAAAQQAAEGHADARLEAPLTRGPGDVEYAVPGHVTGRDAALSERDRAKAQERERQDREDVTQARLEELANTWPTPVCPDAEEGTPHPGHRIEGTFRRRCPGVPGAGRAERGRGATGYETATMQPGRENDASAMDAADAPEVVTAEASLAARQAETLAKVDAVLDQAMAHVAHWQGVVSMASALRNQLQREAHHGPMSTLPAWAAPVVPQEAPEDLEAQEGSQEDLCRWATELRKHGFSVTEPVRRPGDFRPGDIVRVRRGCIQHKVLHQNEGGLHLVRVIAMNTQKAVPVDVMPQHLTPWE